MLRLLQWPRRNRVSGVQHSGNIFRSISDSCSAFSPSPPGEPTVGPCQSSGSPEPPRKSVPQNQPCGKGAVSHQPSRSRCSGGNLRPGTSPGSHVLCPHSPSPGQSWSLPTILCLPGLLLTPSKKPSCRPTALAACICSIQLQQHAVTFLR